MIINLYYVSSFCEQTKVNQTEWFKDDYPNPQVDTGECGRCNKTSWICDPNHILPQDSADKLDGIINGIRQSGKCVCTDCKEKHGVTIAIAVLDRMKNAGSSDENIEATAKEFVKFLRERKWRIGICNDEIVVLLSHTDRKIFTNVGTTVSNILTNECLEYIYLNVKTMLSRGYYAMALEQMLDSFKSSVEKGVCSVSPPKTKKTSSPYYGWIGFVVIGALFFIGVSVLGCKFLCDSDVDCDCITCPSCTCCDRSDPYRDTPTVVMKSTYATTGHKESHYNNNTGATGTSCSHDTGTTSHDVHMDFNHDSGGGGGDSSGFDGGGGF